jgi:hypothetical protein
MSVTLYRRDGSVIAKGESIEETVEANRANLRDANLRYADLRYANLRDANLRYADLRYANLSDANLCNANLSDANLRNADLRDANLRYADLRYADLRYANLRNADLRYANLSDANLRNADIRNANLRGEKNDLQALHDHMSILPAGEIIGWKKVYAGECIIIARLSIPAEARRSNATGRKCRCDRATVLDMRLLDGSVFNGEAHSSYDRDFKYHTGDVVTVPDFDENVWAECAPGIHFFITETEAREY